MKLEAMSRKGTQKVRVATSIEESLDPQEAIVRKATEWKADLIVMGTHGRRGLDKLLMGSVASSVLHRARHDVMLVRADSELFAEGPDAGPILVPVDFSDHSQRALGLARLVADRYKGRVHLIHVVELLHTPLTPGGLSSRFEESPELKEKYEEALLEMLKDTPGEVTVAEGTVAGEILWWREKLGARLVVMGSRGLSSLKYLFLGSVAEKVARFSEVPVIVVK
jgi:nucleotide-binding universal stress UspA family protein